MALIGEAATLAEPMNDFKTLANLANIKISFW